MELQKIKTLPLALHTSWGLMKAWRNFQDASGGTFVARNVPQRDRGECNWFENEPKEFEEAIWICGHNWIFGQNSVIGSFLVVSAILMLFRPFQCTAEVRINLTCRIFFAAQLPIVVTQISRCSFDSQIFFVRDQWAVFWTGWQTKEIKYRGFLCWVFNFGYTGVRDAINGSPQSK